MSTLLLTAWLTLTCTSLGLLIAAAPPHLRRATLYDAGALLACLTTTAYLLTR